VESIGRRNVNGVYTTNKKKTKKKTKTKKTAANSLKDMQERITAPENIERTRAYGADAVAVGFLTLRFLILD
jgi:hypothetical protein